jgi:hypothetical protein
MFLGGMKFEMDGNLSMTKKALRTICGSDLPPKESTILARYVQVLAFL